MSKSVAARLEEAFEYSGVFHFEKVNDVVSDLTDEDGCNIETLNALKKSVGDVPHELIEQAIQLRARNEEAFENSLTAMCTAVCDTFRPVTAAEFVEMLNKDIRSEIESGESIGREFAGKVQELRAAFPEPVAAQN